MCSLLNAIKIFLIFILINCAFCGVQINVYVSPKFYCWTKPLLWKIYDYTPSNSKGESLSISIKMNLHIYIYIYVGNTIDILKWTFYLMKCVSSRIILINTSKFLKVTWASFVDCDINERFLKYDRSWLRIMVIVKCKVKVH